MESLSLTELAADQIAAARSAGSGRSAHTVHGGSALALRQTLLALSAGSGLHDHESPGEATLLVVQGHIRLATASDSVDVRTGEYLVIPAERHNVVAVDDSAFLLTVVPADRVRG